MVEEEDIESAPERDPISEGGMTAGVIRTHLAALADLPASARHSLRDQLMRELRSPAAATRAASAVGLGRIGDFRAVPLLLEASADPDPAVRWHAVQAIRSLGDRSLIPPGTVVFEDGPLYDRWKHDLLAAMAGRVHSPVIAERFAAVEALASTHEAAAALFLVDALTDEEAPLRWEAGEAVVALVAEHPASLYDVVVELRRLLATGDRVARSSAADVLGQLGLPEAVPLLLPLLHDADAGVRGSVCDALGKLRDNRAISGLTNRLADDDPWIRRAAALALAAIGGPGVQAILLRACADENVIARQGIVKALAIVGDHEAAPALKIALRDRNAHVVLAAVDGLQRIGGRRGMPVARWLRQRRLDRAAKAAVRRIEHSYALA